MKRSRKFEAAFNVSADGRAATRVPELILIPGQHLHLFRRNPTAATASASSTSTCRSKCSCGPERHLSDAIKIPPTA
jgi:hypothetical protein